MMGFAKTQRFLYSYARWLKQVQANPLRLPPS